MQRETLKVTGFEARRNVEMLERQLRADEIAVAEARQRSVYPPPPTLPPLGTEFEPFGPPPRVLHQPRERRMKPFAPPEEDLTDPFAESNVAAVLGADLVNTLLSRNISLGRVALETEGRLRRQGYANPRTAPLVLIVRTLNEVATDDLFTEGS
jgi:hypothetical protein